MSDKQFIKRLETKELTKERPKLNRTVRRWSSGVGWRPLSRLTVIDSGRVDIINPWWLSPVRHVHVGMIQKSYYQREADKPIYIRPTTAC